MPIPIFIPLMNTWPDLHSGRITIWISFYPVIFRINSNRSNIEALIVIGWHGSFFFFLSLKQVLITTGIKAGDVGVYGVCGDGYHAVRWARPGVRDIAKT